MPVITMDDVRSLPDILSTDNFEFLLGKVPGSTDDRDMVIKCQQAVYPGTSHEAYEVILHGHAVGFRGRRIFPRQLSITYVEDVNMDTTEKLLLWQEFIVGTRSGVSGGYKAEYTITPELVVYDTVGREADRVKFYGTMIQDKPDVQLDGGSSQAFVINATFAYDYYESALIGTGF